MRRDGELVRRDGQWVRRDGEGKVVRRDGEGKVVRRDGEGKVVRRDGEGKVVRYIGEATYKGIPCGCAWCNGFYCHAHFTPMYQSSGHAHTDRPGDGSRRTGGQDHQCGVSLHQCYIQQMLKHDTQTHKYTHLLVSSCNMFPNILTKTLPASVPWDWRTFVNTSRRAFIDFLSL